MDPSISAIITKALDGLSLRSTATAHNIANTNSPGYRPLKISFEAELRAAVANGMEAIRALPLRAAESEPDNSNGGMRLDLEMANASETALRYGALLNLLGRGLALKRTIIRGGQ